MSVEKDYSGSYEDDNCVLPVLEGFLVYWNEHVQRIKSELNVKFTNEDFDIEYVSLCLDDINNDIAKLLLKKIDSLKSMSAEKLQDFRDRDE